MNAIISFFSSFADILLSLVGLVVTVVESAVWYVTHLPSFISSITAAFSFVPDFLFPFLTMSVSVVLMVCIVRMI